MGKHREIGSVKWPDDGPTARLYTDRKFVVEGSTWLAPILEALYCDVYAGPQDGPFGVEALNRLADDVGGVAFIRPTPPAPPNRVY